MKKVTFKPKVLDNFTQEISTLHPKKTFGFFLSKKIDGPIEEYIIFKDNLRDEYNELFEKYGNYYVTNHTGFVSTPEETFKAERYIQNKNLIKVGVFHSHRNHPAFFATVDAALHPDKDLWHMIISLRNPVIPRIKIFSKRNGDIEELAVK